MADENARSVVDLSEKDKADYTALMALCGHSKTRGGNYQAIPIAVENGQVWACWCGHVREQHGPGEINGSHREDMCLLCNGKCDEWQVEFCDWIDVEEFVKAIEAK